MVEPAATHVSCAHNCTHAYTAHVITNVVCAQVLVLTHEDASREEWLPYASQEFAPARPLVLFGRAAKQAPAVAAKHAVRSFWEDSDTHKINHDISAQQFKPQKHYVRADGSFHVLMFCDHIAANTNLDSTFL